MFGQTNEHLTCGLELTLRWISLMLVLMCLVTPVTLPTKSTPAVSTVPVVHPASLVECVLTSMTCLRPWPNGVQSAPSRLTVWGSAVLTMTWLGCT